MLGTKGAGWALAVVVLFCLCTAGRPERPALGGSPAQEQLSDSELSAYVLLELSSPAVRYLRAFTVPCWRPAPSLPSSPLDGSWAVALVTLWNDLTAPNNGLGRLVTAQQLHAEAAAMLGEERYSDSLAILELSVLLRLYPFQPPGQLAAWQRSMALAGVAHPRVRLQLARTLVLVARAGAGTAGAALAGRVTHADMELLEGALLAAEAALALFRTEGVSQEDGPADPSQLPSLVQQVKEQVAALLGALGLNDLRALAANRGVVVQKGSTRRAALQALLPVLRIPLQLLEVASPSRSHVAVAPDSSVPPRYSEERYAGDWELYRAVVGDVLTLLPATLLQEVGIQCEDQGPGAGGCQAVIDGQLEAQAGEPAGPQGAHRREVEALLGQADLMEEVLWRLEEVLVGTSAGVRMADGTTWLRQAGWDWRLAPSLHSRLYPPGAAMPEHDTMAGLARGGAAGGGSHQQLLQQQQQSQPLVGDQLCLDKTFLLDTVVKMDPEALQGVQYALDNLHYAQFSAGSAERFWQMLGSSQLEIGLDASHRAQLAQLLSTKYGASTPADLDELLSGVAGGGGWKREGAASDSLGFPGVDSTSDPFIAAFLGMCALGVASVYVYGNRRSLLPPWQGLVGWGSGTGAGAGGGGLWEGAAAAQGAGGRSVARRNAATGALREALAEGNQRKLAAAIEEAEASGVERPLLEKARKAMHALRKKKSQGKQQHQPQQALPGAVPRQGPPQPEPPAVAAILDQQIAQPFRGNRTDATSSEGTTGKKAAGAAAGGGRGASAHRRTLSGTSVGATVDGGSTWDLASRAGSMEPGGSLSRSLSEATASVTAEAAWEAPREFARRGKGAKSARVDVGGERQLLDASPGRHGSGAELADRQPPPGAVQAIRTGGGAKGAHSSGGDSSSGGSSSSAGSKRRGVKPAAAPLLVPEHCSPGQVAAPCLLRKTSDGSDPPTSPGTPLDFNPSRSTSAGADSLEPPSPPYRTPAVSPHQPLPARAQQPKPPAPPPQQAQQQADAAPPLRARLRGGAAAASAQQAQHPAQAPLARQALPATSHHTRSPQDSAAGGAGVAAPYFAGSGAGGEPPRSKVLVVARPQRSLPSTGKRQAPKQAGGSAAPSPKQPAQARNAGAGARSAAFIPPPPPPPKPSNGSSSEPGSHGATSPAPHAAVATTLLQQHAAPSTTASSAGDSGSASPAATDKAPTQPPQATVTFTPGPADRLSSPRSHQQGLLRHGSGGAWSSKAASGVAAGLAGLARQRGRDSGSGFVSSAPSSPRVANAPPPPPPRQHVASFPAAAGLPNGGTGGTVEPSAYYQSMAGAAIASLDASPRSPDRSRAAAAAATSGRSASYSPSPYAGGERDLSPISSWPLGTAAVPAWARQGSQSPEEAHLQAQQQQRAGRAVQFHPAGAHSPLASPYARDSLLAGLRRQASASPSLFEPRGDPYVRPATALLAHRSLPSGYSSHGMGVYEGAEGEGERERDSPRPVAPASAPALCSLGAALSPHRAGGAVSATHQSPELLGKLKEIWGEESGSAPEPKAPYGPICSERPAGAYTGSVSPSSPLAHAALPSSGSSQSSRHSSGQGLLLAPEKAAAAAPAAGRAPTTASAPMPLFAPSSLLVPAPELSWGWQGARGGACAGGASALGGGAWAPAPHSGDPSRVLLGPSEGAEEVPGPSMSLDLAQLGFTELNEA